MDKLTQDLLDAYQRDFPITSEPFVQMAKRLGCQENELIKKLEDIKKNGIVTRIGPVFDHRRAGSSLLAAIKVPPPQLEKVAEQINQYAEVNHNYGREHAYNLWFVVTAPSKSHLNSVLDDMELTTGFPVLRLPMEKAYHIDLGFHVSADGKQQSGFISHLDQEPPPANTQNKGEQKNQDGQQISPEDQNQLRVMIQDGLPLVSKPFEFLAQALNLSESSVISMFEYWLESGLIKRIGLITNHHRIGFTSNAMVVWSVPDSQVDAIGEAFKQTGLVSLCYRRRRHLPEWSYNLYCMIHSRDRETVEKHIVELVSRFDLQDIPRETLFSNCQFKQKGGQYILSPVSGRPVDHGLESAKASNQPYIDSCAEIVKKVGGV